MKILLNGEERDVPDGIPVAELIRLLGLRPEHVAVERNGGLVPRDRRAEVTLVEGDAVEVVTFVGGG